MKYLISTLLLLVLFSLESIANDAHPKAYESLGDEIYNNLSKIENLKTIQKYNKFKQKIEIYVQAVKDTKKLGFEVVSGKKADEKLDYLYRLREHKKINDYFLRSINDSYKYALDNQDNSLFEDVVNSGLLDVNVHKKSILSYYKAHSSELNPQGIIQVLLDEEELLKNKKKYKPKTKEQLQAEKVKRLRENDRLDQEALEKKLAEELRMKKEKIIQEQEKELFR